MPTKIVKTGKHEGVQVPLRFNVPVNMPSKYATNLLVQSSEHEIIIYFFEAQPPIIFGDSEEDNIEEFKKIGIRADCVAKITVAKERFANFVNALNAFAENS